MSDIQLLIDKDQYLDCEYNYFLPKGSYSKIGNQESLKLDDIEEIDEDIPGLEEEILDIQFEDGVSKADKVDYIMAASCGVLSGTLSILWGKKFSLDEAHKWGNDKADSIVKSVAKSQGYKKDDLEGAIRFLEEKYPMAGDALTNMFGGGRQHHLRDFSHHPTPIGLICSIGMQFTGTGLGTDTQGNIIHVKITEEGDFIGGTFTEKIMFGTINWFMHLISDFDGSSGSVLDGTGRGTGIPGPLLATLKEIASLPIFRKVDESNINKPKVFSQYVSKLFNGTLIKNEDGSPIPFDLRTEMGIFHFLAEQSKPVIINECLVRTCYMTRRFIDEIKEKNIESITDLDKLEPKNFLPYNSRALTRMVTVSSGTFVAMNTAGTAVKAAKKTKGTEAFWPEFLLSINYVGIGRFAFACATDAEYIKEDVKSAYDKYVKDRQNTFIFDYKFLSLTPEQLQVLYSLKLLAIEYDIKNTKDQKVQFIKKEWLKQWKTATIESMKSGEDYFLDEAKTYILLENMPNDEGSHGWRHLLTLELSLFTPYYVLNSEQTELFKGLKYSNKYLKDVYVKHQSKIKKEDFDEIIKTYKNYVSRIKESGKKAAIGVGVTAVAAVATGGFALAFAPEIAVVIAGESFAGLYGAALTNAALASIGGGSLAAGGLGMAGGTAILTGGGALLGMAGTGTASLAAVLGATSELLTLNECAKLLTFSKMVIVDELHKPELLHVVGTGVDKCITDLEIELGTKERTKENKKTIKHMEVSIKYLENCLKELDRLKQEPKQRKTLISSGTQKLIGAKSE